MRRARWAGLLLGVGAAAGAAAAAAFAIGLVGDVILDETPREPRERTYVEPGRAAILEADARRCAEQEPAVPSTATAWRTLLGEFSWSAVSSVSSGGGPQLAGVSLLVVPRASCLAAGEVAALRRFVQEGGGLVVAGPLGTAPGRAPDTSPLREMLGAERFEALPDERPALVALPQGSPLASGLEALSLATPRRSRVIAVATGAQPYWSDSRLRTLDPSLPRSYHSAALTSSYGKGRVAWLGFAAPGEGGPEAARVARLLRSAAAWAAGRPVVSLAPWPGRYRSAVLLRANVAGQPRNSAFVARTLLDARVRGAFVLPDGSADELAGLEPPLARAGELALATRRARGATMASRLAVAGALFRARRLLGAWPSGLLDAGATEAEAARASAASGLAFVLSEAASGSMRPVAWHVTSRFGPWWKARDVVSFSRCGDDDLGLSPLGVSGLEAPWLRRRLLADFEAAAALGGLYVLSFHTNGLGAPEQVETLAWLVREFRARGAWVAGPAELASWWLARAGLELFADAATPGRLRLRVHSSGATPAQVVAVDVHAPAATHAVVEPASADCEAAGDTSGVERLLLRVGSERRDYLCEVAFVP